jgi:hypothetical protein
MKWWTFYSLKHVCGESYSALSMIISIMNSIQTVLDNHIKIQEKGVAYHLQTVAKSYQSSFFQLQENETK